MKIHAKYALLAISREFEYPSGSWVRVERAYPEIRGAVTHFDNVDAIQPGDRVACGTACSEWRGTVIDPAKRLPFQRDDPELQLPADNEEVRYLFIAANGSLKIEGYTRNDGRNVGEQWEYPLIGECAANAWPGGDVSIVRTLAWHWLGRWVDGYFAGGSGVAESFDGYMALRRRQGVIAQGETK